MPKMWLDEDENIVEPDYQWTVGPLRQIEQEKWSVLVAHIDEEVTLQGRGYAFLLPLIGKGEVIKSEATRPQVLSQEGGRILLCGPEDQIWGGDVDKV